MEREYARVGGRAVGEEVVGAELREVDALERDRDAVARVGNDGVVAESSVFAGAAHEALCVDGEGPLVERLDAVAVGLTVGLGPVDEVAHPELALFDFEAQGALLAGVADHLDGAGEGAKAGELRSRPRRWRRW